MQGKVFVVDIESGLVEVEGDLREERTVDSGRHVGRLLFRTIRTVRIVGIVQQRVVFDLWRWPEAGIDRVVGKATQNEQTCTAEKDPVDIVRLEVRVH